jgi:hypothetical protein
MKKLVVALGAGAVVLALTGCGPQINAEIGVRVVPVPGRGPVNCVVVNPVNEDGVAVSCDWSK